MSVLPGESWAFVPAVASWGSGGFGEPDGVTLVAGGLLSAVDAGPLVRFAGLSELAVGGGEGVIEAFAMDPTNGPGKQRDAFGGPWFLDASSVERWWCRDVASSSFYSNPSRQWGFYVGYDTEADGLRRVTVETSLVQQDASGLDPDGLLVDVVVPRSGWYGFVGVGTGWASESAYTTYGSVFGYGTSVIAGRNAVDLDAVDEGLVVVTLLDDERVLLRTQSESDLVAAVAEIRRACWCGWGPNISAANLGPGTLCLEGPSVQLLSPYRQVDGFMRIRTGQQFGPFTPGFDDYDGSQPGTILLDIVADEAESSRLEDVTWVVKAWQRYATALTKPDEVEAERMVRCTVTKTEIHLRIEHGPCAQSALALLQLVLSPEYWSNTFKYDGAPIETEPGHPNHRP